MTVIPFKRPGQPPPSTEPLFVIHSYPGEGNGFDWVVSTTGDDPPSVDELSSYLGDMFIALNPQPPGILERIGAFIHQFFPSKGDDK